MKIVVAGYIVRGPLGGMAWHHLQYVLGLANLGHDVAFIEDSDDFEGCYDPERDHLGRDPTFGLRFAGKAFSRLGLEDRWAYHDAHAGHWEGPLAERAEEVCAGADLLLNLSGVNRLRPWLEGIPARALVDTDPVFTQVRHLRDPEAMVYARRHTSFFSFAENLGQPGCTVPDDGLPWLPTRQPVVLDAWLPTPGSRDQPFTTVMQWEAYRPAEHDGVRYGMKADSFRPYLDRPLRTPETLEIALGGADAPRGLLKEHGWHLRHPYPPTRDPWAFQGYVQTSKGEFSVAKHGYVTTTSGWFSERSTGYLASGRPVIVQDTGFGRWFPSGEGVLGFGSNDEAVAALAEVEANYDAHCAAARALVEEHFDARTVLPRLVEQAVEARGE